MKPQQQGGGLTLQELDLEDQGRAGRDDGRETSFAVSVIGGTDELGLFSQADDGSQIRIRNGEISFHA